MRKNKSHLSDYSAKHPLPAVASEEAWRQKAQAMFPYSSSLVHLLADAESNAYDVFHVLLPLCQQAYRSQCDWELQRIFDYADWCWRQDCDEPRGPLSDAAGMGFYEHLLDNIPLEIIRKWVKPDLYESLQTTLETSFISRSLRCAVAEGRDIPDFILNTLEISECERLGILDIVDLVRKGSKRP